MKPIRLVSGFFTVSAWTLASRVLGFFRDVLILALLGTGPFYEAYIVAFRLPNMFRRFFAEGAFNTAFVPMFSKKLERGDDPQGFADEVFAGLAAVLLALTLLAQLAMPLLIWAMASGFAGQERFTLAVEFGRIAFPYILFVSLAAMLSGMLNALGRFAAAAAAPIMMNVLMILAMAAAVAAGGDVARALVWTIPVAGMVQMTLVWTAATRAGLTPRLRRPRLTARTRKLVRVAVPAMLAGGVVQINLLVGQQVASYFDGAVAWLFAADRLYQLPLGVIGIAIGIVLLPDLTRRLAASDGPGGQNALSRAGEIAMALTLPATVALIVIPLPIVSVLFERGATTAADSRAIALAVTVYGLGLPAFVLQKILQPLYFARSDTKNPFRIAVNAMFVNAVAAVVLIPFAGWLSPALAAVLASWVMVWQLGRRTRDMGKVARFDTRFHDRLWRIILSSALMGIPLWSAAHLFEHWFHAPTVRYGALAGLVLLGIASYLAAARLTGAFCLADLRKALRRRA